MWTLYGKALTSGFHASKSPVIPELAAELIGVSTDTSRLKQYASLCGFAAGSKVPVTWPHILAFPLHLKLLTEKAFPLPLLGLVHLRNTITQFRPIAVGECMDIQVRLDNQVSTDKGMEFDLVTEVYIGGQRVWESFSTNLYRQPDQSDGASGSKPKPPALERLVHSLDVSAPESLGRDYGKVSGDLNPIHMHALSARLFGFPRAIAHGMWSKAHCIALLEREGWGESAMTVSASFKKPLFLPAKAQLDWEVSASRTEQLDFQLVNNKGDAPHLTGTLVRE
ncbi:MaoC family dehydratase [Marinobacter sp. 1Y8]